MGVKTIWELCLFQVAPFVSFQGLQMGIFVFWTERDWSRKSCYGNTIDGVILFLLWCTFMVPSFKNTALIFLEILFSQYFTKIWRHHWSNLHNRKMSIPPKRKEIFQKEKRHSSVFWKAFHISRKYFFSCHVHFKTNICGFLFETLSDRDDSVEVDTPTQFLEFSAWLISACS